MIPKLRFKEFSGEWGLTSIKDALHDAKLGGNIDNSPIGTGTPLIKMGNLGRGAIQMDKIFYTTSPNENLDEYLLETGDLLFNTRNTLELVGKVSIWRGEIEHALYNSNILRLKFKNNWFWNHLLNTPRSLNQLRRIATGTTSVAAIYSRDLYKLKFYECQYSEQQKIANFLELVNVKINILSKKKEALETYKKGLMHKIFSQELRFKREDGTDYPMWERVTLNDIVRSNIRYGIVQPGEFAVDGMILIRGVDYMKGWNDIGNFFRVSETIESKYRKARVKNGDLLVSIVGTPGKAVIVPDYIKEANITQTTARVPLKEDQSEIFYQEQINDYRIQKAIAHLIKGAAQPGINVEDVKNLKVFMPSKEEQKQLEKMFDLLNKRIIAIENQIHLSIDLKKGLLQQMFV